MKTTTENPTPDQGPDVARGQSTALALLELAVVMLVGIILHAWTIPNLLAGSYTGTEKLMVYMFVLMAIVFTWLMLFILGFKVFCLVLGGRDGE